MANSCSSYTCLMYLCNTMFKLMSTSVPENPNVLPPFCHPKVLPQHYPPRYYFQIVGTNSFWRIEKLCQNHEKKRPLFLCIKYSLHFIVVIFALIFVYVVTISCCFCSCARTGSCCSTQLLYNIPGHSWLTALFE